jgi:hypothetical protein
MIGGAPLKPFAAEVGDRIGSEHRMAFVDE